MGSFGLLNYSGAIGANTPLRSLALTGGVYTLPEVTTTGDQTYAGTRIFLPDMLESAGGV
jgi:hypothetical protein